MPGKPRGKPFEKGNTASRGRQPGSIDRKKLDLVAWMHEMAMDPEWRDSFRRRAIEGDATLDREIIARTAGKVPDVLQVETPAPLVVDLVRGPGEPAD